MSGHSKWSTIKRKKGVADAKRGQLFTRLAREIAIAAREGGGDPDINFRLRLAIDRARANNMPKDNIDRAIRRGTGEDRDGGIIEEIVYEGYAPHAVALIIECVTDNRNRAVADIRHILNRCGGSLGEGGSVAWQFSKAAYFAFPAAAHDPDELFELAVESGADDVVFEDEFIEIIGQVQAFKEISDRLQLAGVQTEEAGLRMIPNHEIELGVDDTLQVMRVIEALEDLDDVQNVFSNLHISEDALTRLEVAEISMLAIGIDPGTATTGYGLIREEADGRLTTVDYGVILTPAKTPMPDRLAQLYKGLVEILDLHRPESGAVEKLFFQRNVRTAITVGQARGVALVALAHAGVAVSEYTPLEVKQAVTGYGGADKHQVQYMVRALLQLDEIPEPDDAADALAVAICHLHSARLKELTGPD